MMIVSQKRVVDFLRSHVNAKDSTIEELDGDGIVTIALNRLRSGG